MIDNGIEPIPEKFHDVYTAGYAGLEPRNLLSLARGINAVIVDVRFSPHSRNPKWSKKRLEFLWGTRYVWIKEFGNINYKYTHHGGWVNIVIQDMDAGIAQVIPILKIQPIILLCVCREPVICHRIIVADALHQRLGVRVEHLSTLDNTLPGTA